MSVYFVFPAENEFPSSATPVMGVSILSNADCKPSTSSIVICLLVTFVIRPSFCSIPIIYFPGSAFLVVSRSLILLLIYDLNALSAAIYDEMISSSFSLIFLISSDRPSLSFVYPLNHSTNSTTESIASVTYAGVLGTPSRVAIEFLTYFSRVTFVTSPDVRTFVYVNSCSFSSEPM